MSMESITRSEGEIAESTMISINTTKGICRLMSDAGWNDLSRLNALFRLGFTYADSVILMSCYGSEDKRYAMKLTSIALQAYLESFLLPFGWTQEGGILFSPNESSLDSTDLMMLITNSRKAIVEQLTY